MITHPVCHRFNSKSRLGRLFPPKKEKAPQPRLMAGVLGASAVPKERGSHSGVLLCLFKVPPEAVDHAFAGNQIEGCSRKDLSGCQNRVMRLLAFTGIYKNRRESDKGIDTLSFVRLQTRGCPFPLV